MAVVIKDNHLVKIIHSLIEDLSVDEAFQIHDILQEEIFNKLYNEDIRPAIKDKFDTIKACPHCGSLHICKNGNDQFGDQRYLCKNPKCKYRTFTAKTNTLQYYTKCTKAQWLLFFNCLFHKESIIKTASIVGVCENTIIYWRQKTMHILNMYTNLEVLSGKVHLDETLFPIVSKGVEITEATPVKRGMSSNKINVACAIDEKDNMIIQTSDTGRITSKSLIEIYQGHIDPKSEVVSDSLISYHKLMDKLGVIWKKIPSGKTTYNGESLEKINHVIVR